MEVTLMLFLDGLPYKIREERSCRDEIAGSGGMCKFFLLF